MHISVFSLLPTLFSLVLCQIVPFDPILPVLTSPIVQIKAGNQINYQLVNFRNESCQATLSFHNSTFLSIAATATPKNCAGDQRAELSIPKSAPNGVAALEWQCSGIEGTAVTIMAIFGGASDYEMFLKESDKAVISVKCQNSHSVSRPRSTGSC